MGETLKKYPCTQYLTKSVWFYSWRIKFSYFLCGHASFAVCRTARIIRSSERKFSRNYGKRSLHWRSESGMEMVPFPPVSHTGYQRKAGLEKGYRNAHQQVKINYLLKCRWKLKERSCRDFPAGPGQLLVYCPEGPKLLHYLLGRGQCGRPSSGLVYSTR